MSLRVWLPLTKDLRNQGLDDVTVTNNGATFDVNGKLGGCYNFGISNSYITVDSTPLKTFTEFSFACWVKIISWNTNYSTIFAVKNSTGVSWNNLIFSLLRDSSSSALCFNISNGSNYTSNSCRTEALSLDTWYHITCTYKSGQIKLYQDGNVVSVYNTSVVPNFSSIVNLWIGKSNENSYQSNNLLNDVRIYNHCLSPMEVKEISKGLILHYPLNRGGWGQENLATNTSFPNSNIEGYGGQKAIEYNHSDWTSGGRYFAGDSNSRLTFTEIQANQPYIISAWVYIYSDVTLSNPGGTSVFYRIYKTGDSPTYSYDINFDLSGITERNKWVKVSRIFVSSYTYIYNQGGTFQIGGYNGHFKVSMPKVEKGSIATPWCPSSSDELYNKMGLNDNVEYDTSGYGNNGIKIGTFDYDNDTPKYNVSASFNGTDNCIQLENISSLLQDVFTINFWFKKDNLGSKAYETLFGGPSGFEMDTRSGSSQTLSLYMTSTRGGNVYSPFNFGEWYMVTMVNNGVNELYYINGILVKTI